MPELLFSDEKVAAFRSAVDTAKKPLVFFDNDGDGTTSFTMLYHALGCGKGVPVKKMPDMVEYFWRKVEEYGPDVIFLLDLPVIPTEFLERCTVPVFWIDHHFPIDPQLGHVHYYNPRCIDDANNLPTSYWTWKFVGRLEDLWIAATGVISDWHVPDFVDEVQKTYPDLLPKKWKRIEDLYLNTPVGTLILVILFMLKGSNKDALTGVKTFTRIAHPDEILKQTTPAGKYLWQRYQFYAQKYELLVQQAHAIGKELPKDPYLQFIYEDNSMSYTQELSNNLLISFPKKIIIAGRRHQGSIKVSLRSKGVEIDEAVRVAINGLRGHGGGHKHACGALVHADEWELFLERFKAALE